MSKNDDEILAKKSKSPTTFSTKSKQINFIELTQLEPFNRAFVLFLIPDWIVRMDTLKTKGETNSFSLKLLVPVISD